MQGHGHSVLKLLQSYAEAANVDMYLVITAYLRFLRSYGCADYIAKAAVQGFRVMTSEEFVVVALFIMQTSYAGMLRASISLSGIFSYDCSVVKGYNVGGDYAKESASGLRTF